MVQSSAEAVRVSEVSNKTTDVLHRSDSRRNFLVFRPGSLHPVGMMLLTVLLVTAGFLGTTAAASYSAGGLNTTACSVEYCANPDESNLYGEDLIHLYANYMAWGDDNVTLLVNGGRTKNAEPKDNLTMYQMYEVHGRFEGPLYGQNSITLENCLTKTQLSVTATAYVLTRVNDKILVPCGQSTPSDHDLAKCSIKRVAYGLSNLDKTGGNHLKDTNPGVYTKLAIDTHNALALATDVASKNTTGQACLDVAKIVGDAFLRIGETNYSQQHIQNSYALVYQGKFD